MQWGGGLAIYGTATLTNTNVYTNQAEVLTSRPFPDLQRPAGTFRVLAFCRNLVAGSTSGGRQR